MLSGPQSPTLSTFSARTQRERLNDPSISMLDLDDDPRTSMVSDYDNDDPNDQRLSYLGPNLRFHSPAPWETDDHAVHKKVFTRRPSVDSRPKSKHSLESYPRGALYALAQESLSTSSLTAHHANFSHSDSTVHPSPIAVNHTPYRPPQDDFHPYANPDLVSQALDERHHSPSDFRGISRSDSIGTVTDSISLSRSGTRSTLGPITSMLSITGRNRASTMQGREISSPIPVVNTLWPEPKSHPSEEPSRQPGVDNLPGWTERITSPGFSLISLEEARAQRMRSATAHPSIPVSPPLISAPLTDTNLRESNSRAHATETDDSSPRGQRARARSTSAGAKAKGALQSVAATKFEADAGHGKTLKHKKSGFMRLFNGGRGQDREEKTPPPPVPSLSVAYAALSATQKAPKGMSHRIPVPELSPSLQESYISPEQQSPFPVDLAVPQKPSPSTKRPIPPLSINTQRQSYSNHTVRAVDDDDFQTRTAPSMDAPHRPWLDTPNPQSAPANIPEFPSLKLRPVSTMFSAQFGEHIVLPDSRPSLETDFGTPGSSTKVFSPVTPGSSTLSDRSSTADPKSALMSSIFDDQSPVVSALQEQILNSNLAWQRQILELESQVRDLKAEVDELRKVDSEGTICESCGRGQRRPKAQSSPIRPYAEVHDTNNASVVNRPRARTGTSSRFGSTVS
ncbi:hypothetical protein C0991_005116 [Blastosporella zonata]|nr:hypothetical protein C0991_005116 [Blastosporella zonata]